MTFVREVLTAFLAASLVAVIRRLTGLRKKKSSSLLPIIQVIQNHDGQKIYSLYAPEVEVVKYLSLDELRARGLGLGRSYVAKEFGDFGENAEWLSVHGKRQSSRFRSALKKTGARVFVQKLDHRPPTGR